MINRLIFILILTLIPFFVFAENLTYSKTSDDEQWGAYVKELIMEALKAQNPSKSYSLTSSTHRMLQKRALESLINEKGIDIFWTMTSQEREQRVYTLRIPLLKGILGQRVSIIRDVDIPRFNAIKALGDAAEMTYGQGHDWPDADILEHAGLPVNRSSAYTELLQMLALGRFDAFPSGICEVEQELAMRPDIKGVSVDQHIAFSYDAPVFIFLNSQNKKLQQMLEKGFEKIIANGTFDRVFYHHFQDCIDTAGMDKRVIFKLKNPSLSHATQQAMKKYKHLFWIQ